MGEQSIAHILNATLVSVLGRMVFGSATVDELDGFQTYM